MNAWNMTVSNMKTVINLIASIWTTWLQINVAVKIMNFFIKWGKMQQHQLQNFRPSLHFPILLLWYIFPFIHHRTIAVLIECLQKKINWKQFFITALSCMLEFIHFFSEFNWAYFVGMNILFLVFTHRHHINEILFLISRK